MVAPSVMPGRAFQRVDRVSRLLFHWVGRDLSLVPRTGQLPAFTRASLGTAIDRRDKMRTAVHSQPRFELVDLDGDGIRETPGLLLEGSRVNLVENGDYEADAVGTFVVVATVTRDATNVRSGAWACKLTTTDANGSGCYWKKRDSTNIPVTVGQPYTHSFWIYAPAASVGKTFRIVLEWYTSAPAANGISQSGILTLVAGWQRLFWTGTPPASTATVVPTFYTTAAIGVFDTWIDLVQFEAGAFESSAIPTGTAAVTRQPDSFSVPFNFKARNLTTLVRMARPVHADVSGALGLNPRIWRIGAPDPGAGLVSLGLAFLSASRLVEIVIDTATTDRFPNVPVPAGNPINLAVQFKDFATGAQPNLDTGTGYGGFSSAAGPATAFNGQTLVMGGDDPGVGATFYGVLLELKIAAGLYSLAQMQELT